eukprot:TRINITY_DN6583_c0_g1_i1.p1 TRINITY_DN6583_c0_g1~~TRINITY_DN6583_c0_g1_i1.p1  ORF type:complete len:407 (+),score=47.27 TRINITY_DN6583_c0_g1_i1:301-1521(+)
MKNYWLICIVLLIAYSVSLETGKERAIKALQKIHGVTTSSTQHKLNIFWETCPVVHQQHTNLGPKYSFNSRQVTPTSTSDGSYIRAMNTVEKIRTGPSVAHSSSSSTESNSGRSSANESGGGEIRTQIEPYHIFFVIGIVIFVCAYAISPMKDTSVPTNSTPTSSPRQPRRQRHPQASNELRQQNSLQQLLSVSPSSSIQRIEHLQDTFTDGVHVNNNMVVMTNTPSRVPSRPLAVVMSPSAERDFRLQTRKMIENEETKTFLYTLKVEEALQKKKTHHENTLKSRTYYVLITSIVIFTVIWTIMMYILYSRSGVISITSLIQEVIQVIYQPGIWINSYINPSYTPPPNDRSFLDRMSGIFSTIYHGEMETMVSNVFPVNACISILAIVCFYIFAIILFSTYRSKG